jgi:hypothetical protein
MSQTVTDPILARNIVITLDEIVAQIEQADKVNTRAKTGYYKMAIYLSASIVEALLYHLIERAMGKDPKICEKVTAEEHKQVEQLNQLNRMHGSSKVFKICEIKTRDFKLGKTTMLKAMNDFCYETKLIDERLHKSIEYAGELRNKIHLQGLKTTERHFNSVMLNKVFNNVLKLYEVLDNL